MPPFWRTHSFSIQNSPSRTGTARSRHASDSSNSSAHSRHNPPYCFHARKYRLCCAPISNAAVPTSSMAGSQNTAETPMETNAIYMPHSPDCASAAAAAKDSKKPRTAVSSAIYSARPGTAPRTPAAAIQPKVPAAPAHTVRTDGMRPAALLATSFANSCT